MAKRFTSAYRLAEAPAARTGSPVLRIPVKVKITLILLVVAFVVLLLVRLALYQRRIAI